MMRARVSRIALYPETGTMPDTRRNRSILAKIAAIFAYTGAVFENNTLKHTIVFFFRSITRFRLTSRWIGFLEDYGQGEGLGQPPLELVRKAFGAYFIMNRSLAEREALLEHHYRLASERVPKAVLEALWAGEPTELGRVSGKKDDYIVWLRRADQCGTRHEGEWTFGFECRISGLLLCRITVLLVAGADGRPSVAIGGLQGPSREVPKSALVTATRDLGGLRPKDAMLLVTGGLAKALGAGSIFAVDNLGHPINYRAQRRRAKMLTDYDDYWRDRGGEPGPPFGFVLPVRDPFEAEPGNKRRDEAKQAFFACGNRLLR